MTRVLLDTNIVIAVTEDRFDQLSKSVRTLLRHDSEAIFVSVTSLWEIAIKHRLGKLELSVPPKELSVVLRALNFQILEIEEAHVFVDIAPEPQTSDPFDRLLLGVCAAENLELVTRDRVLAKHPLAWKGE